MATLVEAYDQMVDEEKTRRLWESLIPTVAPEVDTPPPQTSRRPKTLAEALLRGMRRFPRQAFGNMYGSSGDSACAIGTIYAGLGVSRDLLALGLANAPLMGRLDMVTAHCPEPRCEGVGWNRGSIASVLVHLNDGHRWGRKAIYQWLEKNGW